VRSDVFAYRFDDLPLVARLGRSLTTFAADALEIAVAVYVADRLGPRHDVGIACSPGERWPRRLHLRIPVREPDRWRAAGVGEQLEALLSYWTNDDWTLVFVSRSSLLAPGAAVVQRSLLAPSIAAGAAVILHSGGLDGTLGLLDTARCANGRLIVPASVTTNRRAGTVQDRILVATAAALRLDCPQVAGVRAYANLSRVRRSQQEPSQRARPLLYLTVGAVAALLTGERSFTVAEHGTGAINLPYSADQIGARTTKAVHPRALARFADTLAAAAGEPIEVENPLLWRTKGEACALLSSDLLPIARETVTCDGFPRRYDASRACGHCTNCLVRRAALVVSGHAEVDGPKHRALDFDPTDPDAAWPERAPVPLYALRGQVEAIRLALAASEPRTALARTFPELHEVVALHHRWGLTETQVTARLIRLYTAYVAELGGLFAMIGRPGWKLEPSGASLALPSLAIAS